MSGSAFLPFFDLPLSGRAIWFVIVRSCSSIRHCQVLQCQVLHFQRPHPGLLRVFESP